MHFNEPYIKSPFNSNNEVGIIGVLTQERGKLREHRALFVEKPSGLPCWGLLALRYDKYEASKFGCWRGDGKYDIYAHDARFVIRFTICLSLRN
jgi:hypothetical protein